MGSAAAAAAKVAAGETIGTALALPRRGGRWRDCFFVRRQLGQAPFARGILGPNDFRFDQRDLPNHEAIAEKRPELHPELEALRLQEIASDLARLLRDGDAIEFQSAPWGDADLAQMKGCAEPLAEFLLNPMVRALRLHIQVDPEQGDEGQDHGPAEEPEQKSAEFFTG